MERRKQSGEIPSVREAEKALKSLDVAVMNAGVQADAMTVATSTAHTPVPPVYEGDWEIRIRGRGPHHNASRADANRLASTFVQLLRDAGHTVTETTFKNGATETIE